MSYISKIMERFGINELSTSTLYKAISKANAIYADDPVDGVDQNRAYVSAAFDNRAETDPDGHTFVHPQSAHYDKNRQAEIEKSKGYFRQLMAGKEAIKKAAKDADNRSLSKTARERAEDTKNKYDRRRTDYVDQIKPFGRMYKAASDHLKASNGNVHAVKAEKDPDNGRYKPVVTSPTPYYSYYADRRVIGKNIPDMSAEERKNKTLVTTAELPLRFQK